jgi:hypothetical protein
LVKSYTTQARLAIANYYAHGIQPCILIFDRIDLTIEVNQDAALRMCLVCGGNDTADGLLDRMLMVHALGVFRSMVVKGK